MTAIGIIPARHASTRFPGKPLVVLHGRPMIEWVHERVRRSRLLDAVIVATDDARIRDVVRRFGGTAVLTSGDHATGTDRVAEVARDLDADIVVNVQGDEPLVDPEGIDAATSALLGDPSLDMATLACPLREEREFHDPSVVKVVVDGRGRALYFSRSAIPHRRGAPAGPPPVLARRHVGLYAYRRRFLLELAACERSPLETCEDLEQLRALERGAAIHVAPSLTPSPAVDTPADVPGVEARLRELHGAAARAAAAPRGD